MDFITRFKGFNKVLGNQELEDFVKEVTNGTYAAEVSEIRRLMSEGKNEEAQLKKKSLEARTVSALYRDGRKDINIKAPTGLQVMDIDKQSTERLAQIRLLVDADPHTLVSFISPGGNGLKIIARTEWQEGRQPVSVSEIKSFHAKAYQTVMQYYACLTGAEIDTSGKDLGRLVYVSYDPACHYAPQAKTFNISVGEVPAVRQRSSKECAPKETPTPLMFKVLTYLLNQTEKYAQGNRNVYVFKLMFLCNQYGISSEAAWKTASAEFDDMPPDELQQAHASAYSYTDAFRTRRFYKPQWRILTMKALITRAYITRYNEVKCRLEFHPKGKRKFTELSESAFNTLWTKLCEQGAECTPTMVHNLLFSEFSPVYNPLKEYFDRLPAWDGTDHIGKLAATLHTGNQEFWEKCLGRWLAAMVATALHNRVANHTSIVLSGAQSIGKTTWCNHLLPPELSEYCICGNIDPTQKDDQLKLITNMLVNLDEFRGLSFQQLGRMKDMMSKDTITLRLPYGRNVESYPRRASFIASTNDDEVLNDPTGSRRFLCFRVTSVDNSTPIDYKQLYAQVKHLLSTQDYQFWFDKDETKQIENNNESFQEHSMEEDLFYAHFVMPNRFDAVSHLTMGEISALLRERTGYQMNAAGMRLLATVLKKGGFNYKRSNKGVKYELHMYSFEQVKSNQRG